MTSENLGVTAGALAKEIAGSPYFGLWDRLGRSDEALPFFSPNMDMKARGFVVQFLSPVPRRESQNRFNLQAIDCWFDIHYVHEAVGQNGAKIYKAEKKTWTISQISLLAELKKYAPLNNKIFQIRLVRVDAEWKKKFPNFRGVFRYEVTFLGERVFPSKNVGTAKADKPFVAGMAEQARNQPIIPAGQTATGSNEAVEMGQPSFGPMPALNEPLNPLERPVIEEIVA